MKLNNLFRVHAILAFAYAVLMILIPQFTISLLSPLPLNAIAIDITRILGAAILFVGLMAWGASSLSDKTPRRMIAIGLLVYTGLGAAIALMGQLAGNWGILGWSNFLVYFVVAIGYAYFIFLKPE